MNDKDIISKAFKVIESCKTSDQLEVARTYTNLVISSMTDDDTTFGALMYGRKVMDETIRFKAAELSSANKCLEA